MTGIVGYVILLLIFTGIGLLLPFHPDTIMELGVTLIFYGVYFGVMGRDCAEMCVDYMAAGMIVSHQLIAIIIVISQMGIYTQSIILVFCTKLKAFHRFADWK